MLDRETGEFLLGQPYAKQTWAEKIDAEGRPIVRPNITPTYEGTVLSPNLDGATSWWSPSFSSNTGLFYVTAHDTSGVYTIPKLELEAFVDVLALRHKLTDEAAYEQFKESFARSANHDNLISTIRAISPETGVLKWEFRLPKRSTPGILTTGGDLLFAGSTVGDIWALDAFTGKALWHGKTQGWIHTAPITYLSEGQQFVTIASSKGIYTFGPGNEVDSREDRWQLSTQEGNNARLVFPPDNLQIVRIAIEKAETDVPWHIQVSQPQLLVKSNQRYAVRFKARADGSRNIVLGFSQAHPPWEGLGLYKKLELTSEWQDFDAAFVAPSDEDNARIRFDLGGSDISVELSGVAIHSLPTDK